ncbi:MAG TPA: hypothetical protein VJM08_09105 [Anaerolineales bacterium]|nr:hypothetical protein [Anaerolineales bacterium]
MIIRFFLISVLIIFAAGCRISPQTINTGVNMAEKHSDEIAKLLIQSGDDIARQAPKLSSHLIYDVSFLTQTQLNILEENQNRIFQP